MFCPPYWNFSLKILLSRITRNYRHNCQLSASRSSSHYDWGSGQFSTWTESDWANDAMDVRLFLIPSKKFEASQREDSYEETIRDLTQRLKDAENRASEAERVVNKLQKEVDRLEATTYPSLTERRLDEEERENNKLKKDLQSAEGMLDSREREYTNLKGEMENIMEGLNELLAEKEKYKAISDELDATFAELAGY